jgi:acyl-[acyl-carrier-protein] desaturase
MTTAPFLHELEPAAARLLDRHMATAREWFPHELVPYSRGRDYEPDSTWSPADADLGPESTELPGAVASALFVNLLTEDNLPYYFRDVQRMFGKESAYGTWSRNWTAEEGRHSIVIRDYLTVTRAIDPIELERGRMTQVRGGQTPAPEGPFDGLVYLSLQELATRIAHRNTGKLLQDPAGFAVMSRVANDENLHYLFYRDLAAAAIELEPSVMVIAMERAVREFTMPGTGIPGFDRHSRAIAKAGIYDLHIHYEQILVPVILHHWRVQEITGLTPEADKARDSMIDRIERIGRAGRRLAEHRLESASASASASA